MFYELYLVLYLLENRFLLMGKERGAKLIRNSGEAETEIVDMANSKDYICK